MKVLVLGNDLIVQRLAIALGISGIEVDGLKGELPLDLEAVESRQYDLIIIDSLLKHSARIAALLCDLYCTPVYLLMSDNSDDWKVISKHRVDGFLAREVSDTEIRIRIKAACRPKQLARLPARVGCE